ncbi:hypothetical protein Y032_0069g323 [Ancylostoma ceylanicum]|uniref:Uncharacterized protein n=1 Tax=Ancylostoma ceylanicum TaxID=53326 RepID=A0A016TXZ2_9BILA|nr:hypothetical protein Y032_0069g323 [Ancylostoma ceylanicum]
MRRDLLEAVSHPRFAQILSRFKRRLSLLHGYAETAAQFLTMTISVRSMRSAEVYGKRCKALYLEWAVRPSSVIG